MRATIVTLLVLILAAVLMVGGVLIVQAGNAAREQCIASIPSQPMSPGYWQQAARC